MPDKIEIEKLAYINELCKKYQIELSALSGTFNMIDPDPDMRKEGCKRFDILCRIASVLHIPIVTLCTGSKNKESKWKWHEDNDSKQAWEELLETTGIILKSARAYDVILGVETEISNIINSPKRAREYMDTMGSGRLKIIMDGANLFHQEQVTHMQKTLKEAFDMLGKDIVLAHAKDIADSENSSFVSAGRGVLDFKMYISLLKKSGYTGALIMHGLSEEQIPESIRYLKERM